DSWYKNYTLRVFVLHIQGNDPMSSTELLRTEVSHYLILADTLKARYGELDDETLKDTLEGISYLPEAISAVIRSSLEDEAYILGLKGRLDDLQARLSRLRERTE